jgi:phenylpyruvate tautomerase PptA (4-oxalocrotonate tautomerase family)
LVEGKSVEYRRTISEVVYKAVVSEFKAPDGDRFQVITEHPSGWIVVDPEYVGITRTVDAIFIQISMNVGRTIEQKKGFYKKVADELNERLGVRREDVFINLVEVAKENWSFGNGIAQYA